MAESKEPKRPVPGAPLPRLWKAEPEPVPEEEPKKKKKKPDAEVAATNAKEPKAKKKKAEKEAKASGGGDKKGVLIEETPTLDTYEARQRARLIVTGVLVSVVGLTILILVKVLSPAAPEEEPTPQEQPSAVVQAPGISAGDGEREADSLYERAHQVARTGNAKQAASMLASLTNTYPRTRAADKARQALERPKQNLPLFLDTRTVVASKAEPPPAAGPEPPQAVVVASAPEVRGPSSGEVNLVLPSNPADGMKPRDSSGSPAPSQPEPQRPSRPLPQGFRPRPGAGVHDSGWPLEIVGDRDGATMVLVPGASFLMGRDDGDPAEAPTHRVSVSTFYIDQHEVTNRQFELYEKEMGQRTERARALARMAGRLGASPDNPVVMVTAREARFYAEWAGKRIPTEAQWEMAARGTDGRVFTWGNTPVAKPRNLEHVEPIQSFVSDVSPYGAYDMGGNAWEWTKDWFDPRYYHLLRNGNAADPQGPANRPHSLQVAIRGMAKNWVVTRREGQKFETRLPLLGFRCALPVEGPDNAFKPATPAAPAVPVGPVGPPGGSIPF